MSKNQIGKELLQRGLISDAQLEDALKNQAIFGGRIGSHLVDIGALEEEQLARLLSSRYKIPFVRSHHFANLPQDVIDLLPAEMAQKYYAVPLQKDPRRLVVALPDPGNLEALDTLGFHCGVRITPVVAAESTLISALHRYYGLERVGQFILVPEEETATREVAPANDDVDEGSWLGGKEQDAMLDAWEIQQREVMNHTPQPESAGFPDVKDVPPPAQPAPAANLDQLGEQFSQAGDREMIADLLINYMAREYRNAAVFLVRKNVAFGWRAVCDRAPRSEFGQFQLGLDEPSLLQTVAETHSQYLGPVPRSPFNSLLLQEVSGIIPDQVLIQPVLLLGRLVGFLYIDNPQLNLAVVGAEMRELALKLAMAFEMLILQNKLAST